MKIFDFLKEENGQLSSTRLISVTWFLALITTWVIMSFQKGQLQDFPLQVIVLSGMMIAGKVIQKPFESQAK